MEAVGCTGKIKLDLLFRDLEDRRLAYATSNCSMHSSATAGFLRYTLLESIYISEKITRMSEWMWLLFARSLLCISLLACVRAVSHLLTFDGCVLARHLRVIRQLRYDSSRFSKYCKNYSPVVFKKLPLDSKNCSFCQEIVM